MASTYSAVQCPNCSRSAFDDNYYKTGELFISCYRCGYNYSKVIEEDTNDTIKYKEEKDGGNGVFMVVKKNGGRELIMLDGVLTNEEIEKFVKVYLESEVDQEKSYLVHFNSGLFTFLLGTPPENFHLSFQDYKVKMNKKYRADDEQIDYPVPIDELIIW